MTGISGRARLAGDGEAVALWYAYINDGNIEAIVRKCAKAFVAVAHNVDGKLTALEQHPHALGDFYVVFDQQDAHVLSVLVPNARSGNKERALAGKDPIAVRPATIDAALPNRRVTALSSLRISALEADQTHHVQLTQLLLAAKKRAA